MNAKQLRASLYDPTLWPDSPSADEVRDAFARTGLTREEAGALVFTTEHGFKKWIAESETNSRPMHPALWIFWQSRVALLRGWPDDWVKRKSIRFEREAPGGGHYDREGRS